MRCLNASLYIRCSGDNPPTMDSRPRSSPNRQRAPSTPRVISGFRSTTFNERLNPILPVPPRVGRGLSITVKQPRKPKNLPTPPRISNENRRRRAPSAPRVISGFRSTTFNERLDPILPAPPRAGPGLNVTVHQSRNSRSLPAPPRISDENRQRRRRGRPGRPRRDMEEIFESSSRRRQSPKHIAYIPEARRPSDRDLSPISEDDSDSVSKRCSILLCIFRNRAHGWQSHRLHVHPPENTTDKELFKHIRSAYRHELQGLWRRYFSLKTLKYIAPLLVSAKFFFFLNKICSQPLCCGENKAFI